MVRDFLYLDSDLLNSLLSQFDEGLVGSVQREKQSQASLSGEAKGGVPIVIQLGTKGEYTEINTTSEAKSAHHYAFNQLYDRLVKDKMMGESETFPFKIEKGSIRIIDGKKIANDVKKLPSLMSGMEAISEISGKPIDNLEDVEGLSDNAGGLGDLIESLTGGSLLLRINGKYIYLNRRFVQSEYAPEFKIQGQSFEGNYELIGIPTNSKNDESNTDPLLSLADGLSKIESVLIDISYIKPLALYKILE